MSVTNGSLGKRSLVGLPAITATPGVLFALLALVPALSGTARGLVVPGLKLSDVVVLVLLAIVIARYSLRGRLLDPVGVTLLAYGVLHLILTLINYIRRPDLAATPLPEVGKDLVSALQYVVIFFVAVLLSREAASPIVWLRWTLGVASFLAIVALLQELGVPGLRDVLAAITGNPNIVHWEEWQDSRATGPFVSWHALGIYLAIHAAIAIGLLFRARMGTRDRVLTGAALLCLLLGLAAALTATPAALTAVALVALVPWRRLSRRSLVIVLSGAGAVVAIVMWLFWPQIVDRFHDQGETVTPGLPRTIAYRILFWTRDYLPIIGRNLLGGYGPLGPNDDIYPHTESMYISVLLAGGILLLVAFVAFLITAVVCLVRAQRRFPSGSSQESLTAAILVVSVFLIAAQTIHPYFNDAGGAPAFTIGLGIVIGQSLRSREAPETAGEKRERNAAPDAEEETNR